MSREDIRIAGTGGQGVVTAGRILAEAAIGCGRRATHSQVYGPQSRGGASRSDVVIATDDIGFPLTDRLDLLIVLSPEAYRSYLPDLAEGGRLIVDTGCLPEGAGEQAEAYPVVDTAREISGGLLATGVVALGVIQAATGIVEAGALRETVAAKVPPRHRRMNLEALEAGMEMVPDGASTTPSDRVAGELR